MLSAIRRSLRAKIVIVVLLTTFAALSITAAALLVYETRTFGSFLLNDAATQANLLADITAPALVFDDPAAAQANLELLSRRREISAAAVYSAAGTLFASYSREPGWKFPPLGAAGTTVDGTRLTVFSPIVQNDEIVGTVYLSSRYDITSRLQGYVLILLAVMLPSFLIALFISLWLAGSVTNPLHAITDVARHVVEHRDFTRRARRTTDDEVGTFVDAFNAMVAEVGQRAAELEASNRALQQETEERRQAEVALRHADQRKDEFLATLAHELRNPLAPMVNAMKILERPALDPGIVNQAHGMVRRQLAQLVRLVDDLLDVSRITSGKLVVRKQSAELAGIVASAVETARPLLDQRRQALTVDLPRQSVRMQGDPVRLSQVFANLLNNAAKYSEPGRSIAVTAEVKDGRAIVRVADQGAGIAPEALTAIFEMFTQVEPSSTAQSGLGVGLTLARRLVELHGGSIVAESPGKGQGSVFTVTLPVDTTPVREPEPARDTPSSPRRRVLLVDDNVDFVTSMSMLLTSLGHDVRVAHDAPGALAIARDLRPDIGFLDLGLPGVSGYELATQLHAQNASTVLVAVSGWGQPRDRERSRAAGFVLHLVKPVELKSIEAAIATLTPEREHV